MDVQLQCYPPLGQVTVLAPGTVTVDCIIGSVRKDSATRSWHVALWCSIDGGAWGEIPTRPVSGSPRGTISSGDGDYYRFQANLIMKISATWTVKFREGEDSPWRWIKDEKDLDDATIVAKESAELPENLSGIISDLESVWAITDCISQSPRTRLWTLQATVPSAREELPSYVEEHLSHPWGSVLRWFALVREWSPWLAPRQGKSCFRLDSDAILCTFLNHRGRTAAFLALSGIDDVTSVISSDDSGGLIIKAQNDGKSDGNATVLVAVSDSFDNAVAAVMYHARRLVEQANLYQPTRIEYIDKDVREQLVPPRDDWLDGLGFCTWNALGQQLTEHKILEALAELARSEIYVANLIIDDNWQTIDRCGDSSFQHQWLEFEASTDAFPEGLKVLVMKIRERHPNVKHVAVWHALLGYWGGISPRGKIAQQYDTVEVQRDMAKRSPVPLSEKMTAVAAGDAERLYNDFYNFLANAGIDCVKTDVQNIPDMWASATSRCLAAKYLDAWTGASLKYFGAKSISCMSQYPQSLFRSLLLQNRPTIIMRNSDDFYPEEPASHPWHVWANACNSIFTRHLNVIPDWDMFQTDHDYSAFHAAARCVSGGPIYITDVPGKHSQDLIRQMTGITPDGKTITFRPSVFGRSVSPYMGYDDNCLLKVGTYHGPSETGSPILGIFNVSNSPLLELIDLACFPGITSSMEYVVRSHATGRIAVTSATGDLSARLVVDIAVRGFDVLCASPVTSFEDVRVANLGLLGKMTGIAAIVKSKITRRDNGRIVVETSLKALGVLGIYISSLPDLDIDKNFMVTVSETAVDRDTVSVAVKDPHVLEIDIESAWRKLDVYNPDSKYADVKVYFDG